MFGLLAPFLGEEILVDAARDGRDAMNLLAGKRLDKLLAELPHQDALAGQFAVLDGDRPNGALLYRSVHPEQQVGGGQVEEMQRVGLEHLRVMQQAPDLGGGGVQVFRVDAVDLVDGLGRGQVMTDRADAAQALHQQGSLPVRMALDKAFETAEFNDMKPRLLHFAHLVQLDSHSSVTFHPGDRIDRDFLCCSVHGSVVFEFGVQDRELFA